MKIYCDQTGPIMANTYLVHDENGVGFILDPGDYSHGIADRIQKDNLTITHIVLTHGHVDHIGGVERFREILPGAQVVACSKETEMLGDPVLNSSRDLYRRDIIVQADILVNDGDTLDVGDMTLKFLHTPGHSPGGMCVLVDDVVFSGDTLFCASIGRTDFWGGDFRVLADSIRNKLYTLPDDTVVLPGHMGQTSIGFEKENNPFVR